VSRLVILVTLLAAVAVVGSGSPALPRGEAADMYLKIKGIDGESEDGAIAVAGLAWNTQADVGRFAEYTPAGIAVSDSGAGGPKTAARMDVRGSSMAGRRSHLPMTIVKQVDKASPKLMEACANGTHLDVEVWSRDDGGQAQLRYTLKDAIITSYSLSRPSDPAAAPTESVSFSFTRIETAPSDPAAAATNLNSSKSN
jgi:type VI protein secretion system component Hcp